MSTQRVPAHDEDPAPPPRPPRRWIRIALYIAGGLIVLAAALLIGGVALLHQSGVRQYVLRRVYQAVNESTGIRFHMRDFDVHLSRFAPSVEMYDVIVDGAPPNVTPPLLQVDHAKVTVQIVSLLQKKWYLRDIIVDHPVAHVIVDENGETNLPKSKTSGQSQTDVFDIGIRHAQLARGEAYYNDRKSLVDADLHDLQFQSAFDPPAKRYAGNLSYHDGKIHVQDFDTIPHNLDAEFEATPDALTIKRGSLSSGGSQFSLQATVSNYADPVVQATYQASIDGADLRRIMKDETLPAGIVQLAGSAEFHNDPNKPLIQNIAINGNIRSNELRVQQQAMQLAIRDLSANYRLNQGNAEVRDVRANAAGGEITASLRVNDVANTRASELQAAVKDISLSELQNLAKSPATADFQLNGTANAQVSAKWRTTLDNLIADSTASVKGTIAPARAAPDSQNAIPVDAEIQAQYTGEKKEVSFTRSHIRMQETSLTLDGTVSQRAALRVQFVSNDLHEVETAAAVFGAVPALGLSGKATFNGSVSGSATTPQISGQLAAAPLDVKGTQWKSVRTGIDINPSHVALKNGSILPANGRGEMTFEGDVGLNQWAYSETSPLEIHATVSQFSLVDLKNLAGVQAPVTGTLSAKVNFRGSQSSPEGQGSIDITQATVETEPISAVIASFDGNGDEIHARVDIQALAGRVQGSATYRAKQKTFDAQVDAPGIQLDQIRNLQARNIQLKGALKLMARGNGAIDKPTLQLTAQIPQLRVQDQVINDVSLEGAVANQVATVSLNSEALNTFIRGQGKIQLTGSYPADASLDTSSISLQPVFAAFIPAQATDLTGTTEVHATVKGPLKEPAALDAHITIPTLSVAYKKDVEFSATGPIQVDFSKGVLNLQRTAIKGTGTDLQLQGSIPVNSAAPISLLALGTVDLRVAEMLSPDVTTSGQVQFNINGYGLRLNPNVQGQIKIVDANFAGDGVPLGLQNGNGTLSVANDRVEIQNFSGKVGSGSLTAKGAFTYRPALGYNVSLVADGIRLLYPAGVREDVDTNFTVTGSTESANVRGQVRLNGVSFAPNFDLESLIAQMSESGGGPPPAGFAQKVQLDISVQSTNDLNLASSKLSLAGAANLRVRGTAAEPVVLGRVNLSSGDLIFHGSRYLLQPSTIEFVNPYEIEPRVNLAVDTTIQQYDIHMLFRGTPDRLRTSYTSEPSLPSSDIINLLVFGTTSEASAANPAGGTLGAQSVIASSLSGQITNRLEKIAGISQLSIDPALGGEQDSPARVTIQQRVTGNLFVTFATDATSTQRQVIKLEYQATPRVSFSGVRDQNGGVALDVKIRKTW